MADDDKKLPTALVVRDGGELALTRPMIATDLDRAGKGQLVYVGRDGEVKNPAAVRYGWANSPRCNLYNREGLPASPFRTDDWPAGSAPKK